MAVTTTQVPPARTPVVDAVDAVTRPWLAFFTQLAAQSQAGSVAVTATGTLTNHHVILGNGGSDIRALASTGTSGQVLTSNGSSSDPSWQTVSSTPGGADTDVQFNDAGSFGGDAALTFTKTTGQVQVSKDVVNSLIVAKSPDTVVSVNPGQNPDYEDVTLGAVINGSGDYIPTDTEAALVYRSTTTVGIELEYQLTPGSPIAFSVGQGLAIQGASQQFRAYQYGGLGTGAVPGMAVGADRNDSGSGAASALALQQRDGTDWYVWMDASGVPRYGSARPTEDDSVSDTSGTPFASGSWVPLALGTEPLTFVSDGAGSPILVASP